MTSSSVNDFRKRMLNEEKEESKPHHSHSIDRESVEKAHLNGVSTSTTV